MRVLQWPGRMAAAFHFAQRIQFSQVLARGRLRWRHKRLTARGLNRALPGRRISLAADWQARLARWPVRLGEEAAWQELPGQKFKGSDSWLALGPQAGGRYSGELHRLELFYHEFLVERRPPHKEISSFFATYLDGSRSRVADRACEWSPYAVTTRLANWLQLLAGGSLALAPEPASRLAQECLLLADYVDWMQETDILANHWLKNLWALALCDWLLSPDPKRAMHSGAKYLGELERQFLPDGAHFELCPMYQAKILAELGLFRSLPGLPDGFLQRSKVILHLAKRWLSFMAVAPKQWANFNDSWTLPRVAGELNLLPDLEDKQDGLDACRESGFVRLQSRAGWRAIVDAGGVGPEFNPAHCHSDILSVVAAFRGIIIIQDPGVLHYSANDERAYLRSAKAHNGPCLADRDHTEIIRSFRIGTAAKGRVREVKFDPGLLASVMAEHHGYGPLVIQRRVSLKGKELLMEDTWAPPCGGCKFRPWLRLLLMTTIGHVGTPRFEPHSLSLEFYVLAGGSRQLFSLAMEAEGARKLRWYVGESFVSEEFGRQVPALEVCATDEAGCEPLNLRTSILPRF